MEINSKSRSANVVFLSTILGGEWQFQVHKCDKNCESEQICGNMYHCKLTGLTHICDSNCNQRILYDKHNSLCRVSGKIFPFTDVEQQAVTGVRRKLLEVDESSYSEDYSFKRRKVAILHTSPFEKAICAVVGPICSLAADAMDLN